MTFLDETVSAEVDEYFSKIPDKIQLKPEEIKYIKKKYKSELTNFSFIDKNDIKTGMIIRYIRLNLSRISSQAVIIKIIKSEQTGSIKRVTLFNSGAKKFWKIHPTNYYIFKRDCKYSNLLNDDSDSDSESNTEIKSDVCSTLYYKSHCKQTDIETLSDIIEFEKIHKNIDKDIE